MILESTFFSLNWERSLISDQIKEKYGLNADLGIQIKTHTHTDWHNAWAHPLAYLCRFQRHYTQTHSYIYERMHQLEMVNNELKSTHFKTTCQVSESTAIAADWFNKIWAKFSPATAGTDAKKKKAGWGQCNVNTPWLGLRKDSKWFCDTKGFRGFFQLWREMWWDVLGTRWGNRKPKKKEKKENSNQLNSLIIYLPLFWTSSTQRKTSEKAHTAEILRKSGMICDKGALTEFMLEEVQKSQTNFPIVYNISFGGTPT